MVVCCSVFPLTSALLMTSSHSEVPFTLWMLVLGIGKHNAWVAAFPKLEARQRGPGKTKYTIVASPFLDTITGKTGATGRSAVVIYMLGALDALL